MTPDEISRLAFMGTPPETAPPYEWLLYYRLHDIYSAVRDGIMTKVDGANNKAVAVQSYETDKGLYERQVLLWRRIEQAAKQYSTDRTVENADEFYMAVYGVRPCARIKEKA